jgi:hypothetical protein
MRLNSSWSTLVCLATLGAVACGTETPTQPTNTGGTGQTGGAATTGGNGTTSGGSSSGGTTSGGTATTSGGTATSGGTPTSGGTATTGGVSASSGGTATGGKATGGTPTGGTQTGGAATGGKATGGNPAGGSAAGGNPAGGSASGGTPGSCDAGSTTTAWATSCPTAPPTTCTAGTWTAGGPQNDSCCSAMTLRSESAHFAVYADESSTTAATAQAAVDHLETVWSLYFGSPMYMREPLCNSATKYKANIHVHSSWGLTGGSWNGNRMGMWIGTGGLSDHWGLAHEFMHGVQSVEGGMACNSSNTCGWVYESHANWAAQQQTEYHTSNVHCSEYLPNAPHLYLGSTRDRYCNWQFMEYLKDKYCYSAVNAIWTGNPAADPFTAIMNGRGWNASQLNDFMGDWAMHNVTWDYQDPAPSANAGNNQGALYRSKYGLATDTSQTWRRLRLTKLEPLDSSYATNRRFFSPFYWAPQRFGYNITRLYPDSGATSVTVTFRGVTQASPNPDWRWGLVATNSGLTTARYSTLQKGSDGQLNFCINSGELVFLVVVATPSTMQQIVWDQAYNTVPRYPYMVGLGNAWPEGFQGGTQAACPSGTVRITNGGGCGPSSLNTSATGVYVGPYAQVLGGTVSGTARIDDHATVVSGTVSGGTVTALSLIGSTGTPGNNNSFNVTGGTAKTTFFPLGWFASGQSLSGGSLVGDVEFQGASVNHSSGDCSGFVDGSSCTAPGTDNTPAPPYTWR